MMPLPAMPLPGMLVLVVGPSGAGKDTLLDAARVLLCDDPRVRFARRVITRPSAPVGEQHDAVDDAAFDRLRASDGFLLCWEAHGLRYGIPAAMAAELAVGRTVVAGVSRAAIEAARARHRVHVVEVTAPPGVLALRLLSRGREEADAVAARLARAVPLPACVPVTRIVNDRTVAEGAALLLAVLRRLSAEPEPAAAP